MPRMSSVLLSHMSDIIADICLTGIWTAATILYSSGDTEVGKTSASHGFQAGTGTSRLEPLTVGVAQPAERLIRDRHVVGSTPITHL